MVRGSSKSETFRQPSIHPCFRVLCRDEGQLILKSTSRVSEYRSCLSDSHACTVMQAWTEKLFSWHLYPDLLEHPANCIPGYAELLCYISVAHSHLFHIAYHSPHLQPVQSWSPSAWGNGSKLNRRSGSLLFRRKCTIFNRRLHIFIIGTYGLAIVIYLR